jgi:hypothetical protein
MSHKAKSRLTKKVTLVGSPPLGRFRNRICFGWAGQLREQLRYRDFRYHRTINRFGGFLVSPRPSDGTRVVDTHIT